MSDTTPGGAPTVVPNETIRARLIQIAAQMARGRDMPSTHPEDYPRMGKAALVQILDDAEHANTRAREWALELKQLADALAGGI